MAGTKRCGMRPLGLLVAGIAVLSLSLATSASASLSGFGSSQVLSTHPTGLIGPPQVVVDPNGIATVAWLTQTEGNIRVHAQRVGTDGSVGPVRVLSPAGADAVHIDMALDHEGRIVVIWVRTGTPNRVQAVRLDANGIPGTPVFISPEGEAAFYPTNSSLGGPQVAVDSHGVATVVWHSVAKKRVMAARLGLAGTVFTQVPVSPESSNNAYRTPVIAFDGMDRARVAWARNRSGHHVVESARIDAAGDPEGDIEELSASQTSGDGVQVVSAPDGSSVVAWILDSTKQVLAAHFASDGNPGETFSLTTSDEGASGLRAVIDGNGVASLFWSRKSGLNQRIQMVRIALGGAVGETENVSPAGQDSFTPSARVDGLNRIWLTWQTQSAANNQWPEATRLSPAGEPGAVHKVSNPSPVILFPAIAGDAHAGGLAAWVRNTGGTERRLEVARALFGRPDTRIAGGLAEGATTRLRTVAFPLAGIPDEAGTTFECSFDGGEFEDCSSPATYNRLEDGTHEFAARAIDPQGEADLTPATRTFTIDRTKPKVKLKGPKSQRLKGSGKRSKPKVNVVSNEDAKLLLRAKLVTKITKGKRATRGKRSRARRVGLKAKAKKLRAGKRKTIRVALTKKAKRKYRKTRRRGGKVFIRFKATVTDAGGNSRGGGYKVRLK